MDHILSHAAQYYRSVVLRITTDSGDRFYRACGFMRIRGSSDPTHRIELTEAEPDGPANGSQPFRSETNIKVIGGWLPSLTFAFADYASGASQTEVPEGRYDSSPGQA